ncbi:MAG: alpha/beta hydrolase [Bdellovibrionales bacterium]|nr:alpha/beta hydrolase [Bdellovibrionales bacterium]
MKVTWMISLGLLVAVFVLSIPLAILILGRIGPVAPAIEKNDQAQVMQLDGGQIRYQDEGQGPEATLMIHGFNHQMIAWESVWPKVQCGRKIRIDVPGYGESIWPASSYSVPEQAKRIIQFMDAMGLKKVNLLGVSMGGSISAWLASQYPDRVKGLVLLAPSGYPGSLQYYGAFGRLVGPGFFNQVASTLADLGPYRWKFPNSRALHALTVTSSYGDAWVDALKKIPQHAWVIWSHGDTGVPFRFALGVAKLIPSATLMGLDEKVGHDIPANRSDLVAGLACAVARGGDRGQVEAQVKKLFQGADRIEAL